MKWYRRWPFPALWPFQNSIRAKINLGIIAIVLLSVVLIALSTSQIVSRTLVREHRSRGIALAANLAARSEDAVLALDFLRLKSLISEIMETTDDMLYAFIQDAEERVLTHTFSGGFPVQLKRANQALATQRSSVRLLTDGRDEIFDFAAPVMVGDVKIGQVRLGLLRHKVTATTREVWWAIFAFAILSVIISDTVGFALARNLTIRIQALQKATERILEGHRGGADSGSGAGSESRLSPAPPPVSPREGPRGDEVQQLADTFDSMTAAIERYIGQLAESKAVLAKSETKYRRIFEDSMDLIFVADGDGLLRDINPAGLALLGYDRGERLIGRKRIAALLEDAAEAERILEEMAAVGFVRDRECTLRTHDGQSVEILLSMTARRHPDGGIGEYEGIAKDITHRKEMLRQLLRADRLASLGQLSAGVAHEINNPLGLILGYTQLLIRSEPEKSGKIEDLRTIEKQTRNCKKIVEDLLNFARRTGTSKTRVNLQETMEAVIGVIRKQLELDNIIIQTHYDQSLPDLEGDTEKLKQVFMNLLINARQAIHKNGRIGVTVGYDETGSQALISIVDDGPGIPDGVREKIFDPFFTTKPTGQGT
ncbi:MAG: PAS domain S-box protein, partial [Desulfobacterales bacterium]|nr:PAS domain S-box protein [Desulfobacterales bacterium]